MSNGISAEPAPGIADTLTAGISPTKAGVIDSHPTRSCFRFPPFWKDWAFFSGSSLHDTHVAKPEGEQKNSSGHSLHLWWQVCDANSQGMSPGGAVGVSKWHSKIERYACTILHKLYDQKSTAYFFDMLHVYTFLKKDDELDLSSIKRVYSMHFLDMSRSYTTRDPLIHPFSRPDRLSRVCWLTRSP